MINIIPFQIPDKGLSNTGNPFLKVGWYFLKMISFHLAEFSELIRHSHLNNIALFFPIRDPIPKPLLLFSLITILYWILQIFLCFDTPAHKNLLWIEVSNLATPFGINKMDI